MLMDGGTQGLYLLPYLEEAQRMIVFDAVDYQMQPGEMLVVSGDDVPRFTGAKKMSLHQTGFQEVIMCASLAGKLPEDMVLIGVQPEDLEDYGGSLNASVKAQIPAAINMALELLTGWGISYTKRETSDSVRRVNSEILGMSNYETGRPLPEEACRFGDERFLTNIEKA
jgi:hydrogenase maturation protease